MKSFNDEEGSRPCDIGHCRPWSAAFLAHHPLRERAWDFLFQEEAEAILDLAARIQRRKPDAIVGASIIIEVLLRHGWSPSAATTVILLDWVPNPWGFGGVDQCYDVIAANAVDLIAGQLQRNEKGSPKYVNMLLSAGQWVAGKPGAMTARL